MSIIADLTAGLDDILGVRDEIGAVIKPVHFVTRTWAGSEPGDGAAVDTKTQLLPSPRIVEFVDDDKIKEGGAIQQGDIMLKMISKQSYPTRSMVDGTSDSLSIEKLYQIGTDFYRVIKVKEKYVTWEVLVRKLSDQTSYEP